MEKYGVLSLSGGLDSSTLLLRMLKENYNVIALSFDYGQKHIVELEKAAKLVEFLQGKGHNIIYKSIKLDGLSDLLYSTLVSGNSDVPEGHYEDTNMKSTVVPNRNKIFSSIIQSVALSVTYKYKCECAVGLGIHAGDHEIYPDCRQEFRDADYYAFLSGNWDGENVYSYTPYLNVSKAAVLRDGLNSCDKLELDYRDVYKNTMTSYKPSLNGNADYKSASSVERILSFNEVGLEDPITYEDESGIVDWSVALNYALNVEEEWRP